MGRPGVLERFLREIRAVAKLRHPNIVAAYSAVRLGESIVFAMEYVEGLDLSKMVKAKGPLPVAHACSFVHQAALGLQHAHEEGLVHRDIKPGNLMLSRKGDKAAVKVLDFGLAKVTREEKVDVGLTSEGQALGTPDCIAPEQILDATSADIRADIYRLGGTLYYLLTGRPPFRASSLYDMYQAHISRDADLLNFVRPEVPAELDALVAKMMAKDPARRFQTPGEVAQALTPYFKKANAAFKSPKADVSQAGQTNAGQLMRGAVSTPTQPATDAGKVAVRTKKAGELTATESRWESQTEFREVESLTDAAPAIDPEQRPPWKKWPIALAASLFGLIALGVIIITIKSKNGETKITAPDDKALKVEKDGFIVEHKPGGGSPTSAKDSENPEKNLGTSPSAASSPSNSELVTNSVGMKLKLIPAGEFVMGADVDPNDRVTVEANLRANADPSPRHRVRITQPFYLGVYEVTQEEFERVTGRNPSQYRGEANLPVESVSWFDAVDYCSRLSKKEGREPYYKVEGMTVSILAGGGYRLPTEAEWEYTCRAGTQTILNTGTTGKILQIEPGSVGTVTSIPTPLARNYPTASDSTT